MGFNGLPLSRRKKRNQIRVQKAWGMLKVSNNQSLSPSQKLTKYITQCSFISIKLIQAKLRRSPTHLRLRRMSLFKCFWNLSETQDWIRLGWHTALAHKQRGQGQSSLTEKEGTSLTFPAQNGKVALVPLCQKASMAPLSQAAEYPVSVSTNRLY